MMKQIAHLNNERGFTLTELLIVIAILAILAAIGIPTYLGVQKRGVRSEASANLQSLRLLEGQYFAENALYAPTTGAAGANQPGNVALIQTAGSLPGFQPGIATSLNYSYEIIQNQQIITTNPLAYAALTPCFTAIATANTNTAVTGDVYAIDCNNNTNLPQ